MNFLGKILKNGLSLGLQFGSRWFFNLILAMKMPNAEYGIFSIVYMLANLLFPMLAFGSNFFIIHKLSQDSRRKLLISSLIITIVVTLLVALFAVLYLQVFGSNSISIGMVLIAIGLGFNWATTQTLFSHLKGKSNFTSEVYIQLLSTVFLVTLTLYAFIQKIDHVMWLIGAFYLISFIPLLSAIFQLRKELIEECQHIQRSNEQIISWSDFKNRSIYAVHDVIAILFSNLPFIFMATFAQVEEFGIFRKIAILIVPLTLIPVIISQVLLNKVSLIQDSSEKLKSFKQITLHLGGAGILLWLLTMWYADNLFKWILPDVYSEERQQVLMLLLLTSLVIFLRTFLEVMLTSLDAHGLRTKALLATTLLTSLCLLFFAGSITSFLAASLYLAGHATLFLLMLILTPYAYRIKETS